MKKKSIIIIGVVVIVIIIGFITYKSVSKPKQPVVKMPKNSIKKVGTSECKFSYEKLCFNIPDDYKCVGNNKCQLSNDKDMLLVQVFLKEKYKEDLDTYIKSGKNHFSNNLVDQEEKELNGNNWITAKSKVRDERYYFIKENNNIYTVKILSLRDSGGKFDELTKTIEESIKINK